MLDLEGFIYDDRGSYSPDLLTMMFEGSSTSWCASIEVGTIDSTLYKNLYRLGIEEHARMDNTYAYITELEVMDTHQRKGLGSHLLKRTISKYRESDCKYLYVQPFPIFTDHMSHEERLATLSSLIQFYSRFGFELIVKTKLEGVDLPLTLMRLDLSEVPPQPVELITKKSTLFTNKNEIRETNIQRFLALGTDYVSNFYNFVDKHVRSDGPFRLGEEILSYMEQHRLVPYESLIQLNSHYYRNFDPDFDHSVSKEDFERQLIEDMEPY